MRKGKHSADLLNGTDCGGCVLGRTIGGIELSPDMQTVLALEGWLPIIRAHGIAPCRPRIHTTTHRFRTNPEVVLHPPAVSVRPCWLPNAQHDGGSSPPDWVWNGTERTAGDRPLHAVVGNSLDSPISGLPFFGIRRQESFSEF